MRAVARKKIGLALDARLYQRLAQQARANGQSRRFLLEEAIRHYLDVVLPSRGTLRPEVMEHFRKSVERNRQLAELLAKS